MAYHRQVVQDTGQRAEGHVVEKSESSSDSPDSPDSSDRTWVEDEYREEVLRAGVEASAVERA